MVSVLEYARNADNVFLSFVGKTRFTSNCARGFAGFLK